MTATFLDTISSRLGAHPYQKKAWQRFEELGLPKEEAHAYRYLSFSKLYTSFSSLVDFVLPVLPEPLVALPMSAAWKSYGAYLEKQFSLFLHREQDPLALLLTALDHEGLFLYIPSQVRLEKPLYIQAPYLHIHVGAGADVAVHACAHVCDLSLEENSKLFIQRDLTGFQAIRGVVKRGAECKSVALAQEAPWVRDDYYFQLVGEEANVRLFGLQHLHQSQMSAHTHVLMEHIAPHTKSLQMFKSVVDNDSFSTFQGKIYVHATAQKTESYQMSRHLLLTPRARAKTTPHLEILADDVKASHGATIGRLSEEAYFYLLSRGVEKKRARKLLIEAFCKEVLCESLPA